MGNHQHPKSLGWDRIGSPPRPGVPIDRVPLQNLGCRTESSFEALDGLRSLWDEASIRLGGSVYLSYDWSRVWWEFYGANKELRIFIFTVGNEIVGIVPLYIESLGYWPIRLRVARLVGANIPPKVFNPPMDKDWSGQMFQRILSRLFEVDDCDLLSFGPVSELYQPGDALVRACDEIEQPQLKSQIVGKGVHTVFSLPQSIDEYFSSLNKSERKKRQYELRLLHREHAVVVDVNSEPQNVEQEFERFVALHTAQWEREGKPGHFGAWPRAKEFHVALVKAQARLGRVRFNRIFADDQLVSSQYAFAFGNTCFWELPARTTGREWDRYSLGSAGAVTMIESAILAGMTQVEGGLGYYDYKVKLGGTQCSVRTFRVSSNSVSSRVRRALIEALRLCVLYGYHKIWYRRVTPRLPALLRRPQWQSWLRLDF